ncbi:MAG: GAP family protein [Solirubrobacterales bacterium]
MNDAIRNMLPFAIGVAVSPIPIVAVVLMLTSRRGKANGLAFVAGAALGLALIGGAVLIAGSNGFFVIAGTNDDDAKRLDLIFGVLLLLGAARSFRKWLKQRNEPRQTPKWMDRLDHVTPIKAGAIALGLAFVNFKNLVLTMAGMTEIMKGTLSETERWTALAIFILIGIAGPAVPVAIAYVAGERAPAKLDALKLWLIAHNNALLAVILLAIGAKLLHDAI